MNEPRDPEEEAPVMTGLEFRCEDCGVAVYVQDRSAVPETCWHCGGGPYRAHTELTYSRDQPVRRTPVADAPATVTLYRPVGQKELDLIAASGYAAFPPRLPFQPIFYPVLNAEYATQIARDWNTKDPASGFVGYVTRFAVRADFAGRYEEHQVGGREHLELWVPAEELGEFNSNIVGTIEVIAEYRGAVAKGEGDADVG